MLKKRFVALATALAIAGGCLVGCTAKPEGESSKPDTIASNSAETSQSSTNTDTSEDSSNDEAGEFSETNGLALPLVDKPVTLNVFTYSNASDLNDKAFAKAVEAVTGVKLNITVVAPGSYQEKLQMQVASKQIPDIFDMSLTRQDLMALAENAAIVNFSEYQDQLPNIKSLYLDNPDNMALTQDYVYNDGLYAIECYNVARDVNHGFMYRKDIFDKNGIKPWTNTDEFYEALKTLKEIYPDSTPFVSKSKLTLLDRMAPGWGLDNTTITLRDGKFFYSGTDPRFKDMLDFMRKLYTEKLLDPEFLTCTDASWSAKMTQDDAAFVTFDWIDRMDLFYNQVKDSNPDYNLRFGYPIGPEGKYIALSKVDGGNLAVANGSNKDVAMKLVDFLLSPAGSKLATLGVEGETYTMNDGKVTYIGFEEATPSIAELEEKYGLFTQSLALRFDPACIYYQYSEKVGEAQKIVTENNLLTKVPAIQPSVVEDAEEYGSIFAELKTAQEVFVSKYIMDAKLDADAHWNDWLGKADAIGVKRLVEIMNQ
jgi:putative aldouronate transport system substrate-binding protein